MKHSLRLLKMRLLLETLDRVPASELHALLMREADFACVAASRTAFPELVFPCLFAERAARALEREARREKRYWSVVPPAHVPSTACHEDVAAATCVRNKQVRWLELPKIAREASGTIASFTA